MPELTLEDSILIREAIIDPIVGQLRAEGETIREKIEGHLAVGNARMDDLAKSISNVGEMIACVDAKHDRERIALAAKVAADALEVKAELSRHDDRLSKFESGYKKVAGVFGLIGAAAGAMSWQFRSWLWAKFVK